MDKFNLKNHEDNTLASTKSIITTTPIISVADTPKRIKLILKNPELPPPPPPVSKRLKIKKESVPSSPPPVEQTSKMPPPAAPLKKLKKAPKPPKVESIKLSEPKVNDSELGINTKPSSLTNQPNRVITFSFQDLGKAVSKSFHYPQFAKDNDLTGSVLTTFTVTEDRRIKDVSVKSRTSKLFDAEAVRAISAYNGKVVAEPGIYTYRMTYLLANKDGSEREDDPKLKNLEKATAGETKFTIASIIK